MSRASQVSTDEEEVPDLVPAEFLEAEATDCLRTMTFVSKRMATKSKLGLSRSSCAELTAVEGTDDEESAETSAMTQTSKASDLDTKCPTNQSPVNIEEIYSDNKWVSSAQIRSTVWLPISQVCGECKESLNAKDSHWSNVEFPEVWTHGMTSLHVGCVDLTGLTVGYRWYTGLLETLKNSLQFARIPAVLPSSEAQGEELGVPLTDNANEVWAYRLAEHIQELGLPHAAKTICTITRDIIDNPAQLGSTTSDQAFGPIWTFWDAVTEPFDEHMSKSGFTYRLATAPGKCYWEECPSRGQNPLPFIGEGGYILLDPRGTPGSSHKHLHSECFAAAQPHPAVP